MSIKICEEGITRDCELPHEVCKEIFGRQVCKNGEWGHCEYVLLADGTSCSKGNLCFEGGVCKKGICTGEKDVNCDDGNICTTDSCDPKTGCKYVNNSNLCNDDNVCTRVDLCMNGQCVGRAVMRCDDENSCTEDSCDAVAGCKFTKIEDCCLADKDCGKDKICGDGRCVAKAKDDVMRSSFVASADELAGVGGGPKVRFRVNKNGYIVGINGSEFKTDKVGTAVYGGGREPKRSVEKSGLPEHSSSNGCSLIPIGFERDFWLSIIVLGFTSILWWGVRWWIIHRRAERVRVIISKQNKFEKDKNST